MYHKLFHNSCLFQYDNDLEPTVFNLNNTGLKIEVSQFTILFTLIIIVACVVFRYVTTMDNIETLRLNNNNLCNIKLQTMVQN